MTLKSFKLFNPTWKVIVYTANCAVKDKTWYNHNVQDFFSFNGSDYMDWAKNLGIEFREWDYLNVDIIREKAIPKISASHLSNFLKWHMMATEGGVYCDMDVLFFRPIDGFYNEMKKGGYTTAICQTEYLSIGLLASAGNDDFFRALLENSVNNYNEGAYQSAGVESIYRLYEHFLASATDDPFPQSSVLEMATTRYPHLKFYNIPFNLIYTWDAFKITDAFGAGGSIKDFPEEAIGYNWYAGHPLVQNFNNLLTEDNYKRINTLFTNIAKEILK